jgi:PST family polysaccharide transporter
MQWTALQRIELTAQIAAATVAVALAWGTALGCWALVAQAWASAAVGLVLTWQASGWRPGRVANWGSVRGALGLGLNLTGFNLVNYFHRQFDNVLIGWRWGAAELGHYTRAYGLLLLPLSLVNGPTSSAVIPALSRVQHEPERWRALYLAALSAVVLTSSLITALLVATAEPLIAVLFGPAWSQSAQIFECLALSMFAATPLNTTGWIHVSTGRTDRMLRWGLAATPVIVLAFVFGLPFGTASVALAYSIAMWVIAIPGMAFAARGTAVGLADMLRVVVPLSAVGVASAVAGLAAAEATSGGGQSSIVSLLAGGGVTVGFYAPLATALILWRPAYAPLRRRAGAWISSLLAARAAGGVHSGARP